MAPTIVLIRHAQALHNYTIPDPALTELGFGPQCNELAKVLENDIPLAQKIELIVISPMRRTIQTASQGLGWLMKRGVPVILRAEWQENSAKPCDTGSSIDLMSKEWPQFDWSTVDPEYPSKAGIYECSNNGLTNRGILAKEWLKNRPEKVIAVVSHSGFLRCAVSYRQYENADFRIFDFKADSLELVEWELTERPGEENGGGLGKSPSGFYPMTSHDYIPKPVGEVVNENPQ